MKNQCIDITVLYVEDEEDIREELGLFLENKFAKIYSAQNGKEGLEFFKKYNPDIVITDMHMPLMNGSEMTKAIKEIDRKKPVIMITAFNDVNYMVESINAGVDKYLLKPIKLNKLSEVLFIECKNLLDERELEKRTAFLKEYKHAVDEAALVTKTDISGVITYANKKFCQILGYQEDELLGKSHNIMKDQNAPKSFYEDMWGTIKSKKVWYGMVRNRAKDGKFHTLSTTIIPIMDEKNEIVEFVALRQDITELEEYKNELEQKVKEEIEKRETQENILIRQSRMAEMGEMLGVIAHQWKQPLNTLSLIIQDVKLAYEAKELDAKYIDDMTENALRSVTFMTETIDDFRNFFKPEQKKEAFCINDSILMIEKILSLQIQQLSITLIKNIDKKIYAFGYQNEFKQVLLNIINNSKDAIKEHKPKSRDNKIIIDVFEEDRWVVIRVSDTGGGIPKSVIDRIFDNYFSTKSKDIGTGIGLYMAKTIIEKKMNGVLSASNIKDGAMFTIKLPKALR